MKTLHATLMVLAITGAVSTSALASDVLVGNYDPYQSGRGGEFRMHDIQGSGAGITGLASDVSANSFQSFCVDLGHYIYNGETVRYQISDTVHDVPAANQNVQNATAWLYFNFRHGTLSGYDYGAGRLGSANALQSAIWILQNWTDENGNGLTGATLAFYNDANAAVAGGWSNNGRVKVLNLYANNDNASDYRQSQLTLVPTPAASLAGFGMLAGLGIFGTRRRNALAN